MKPFVWLVVFLIVLNRGRLLSLPITRLVQSHLQFIEFGMIFHHRQAKAFDQIHLADQLLHELLIIRWFSYGRLANARGSQSYGNRILPTKIHCVVRIKPFVWLIVFLLVLGYGWAQGTIPTPLVLECLLVESPNFQLITKSESLFQLNDSTKKSKAIFSIKQEKLKTKIWDI